MADTNLDVGMQKAGDIKIHEIFIIDKDGNEIDIQAMMVELNIFEDIFSNGLYGNIVISDGQNLIQKLPIIGEEYIRVKCGTNTFEEGDIFHKTYKVYSITDRAIVKDDRMQSYILHFCSPELMVDALVRVQESYSGRVDNIVEDIYRKYLLMPRNLWGNSDGQQAHDSEDSTDLLIIGETKNSIKFTSPRWSPFKCLNWLASKSIPSDMIGSNYLLFETNKQFVYASIEKLIESQINRNTVFEHYIFRPNNVQLSGRNSKYAYTKTNIPESYRIVESFNVENNFNTLDNIQNGYYASKLFHFDVISKDYTTNDFDYVASFGDYRHLETIEGGQGGPFFTKNALRNVDNYPIFYPKHPGLYTDIKDNANEVVDQTIQNRISLLNDLNNYKINMTVPGRTDIEVGNIIIFDFPNISPKDNETTEDEAIDKYTSGLYLITAIRHKITFAKHTMIMEVIKDSTKNNFESASE